MCPFPCLIRVDKQSGTFRLEETPNYQCSFFLVVVEHTNLLDCPHPTDFAILKTMSSAASLETFQLSILNAALYAIKFQYSFYIRIASDAQLAPRTGHFSKVVGVREVILLQLHKWIFFSDCDAWFRLDTPLTRFVQPGTHMVLQEEKRVASSALLFDSSDWTLGLLHQWYDAGMERWTHVHPFEQTALYEILNRRMSGLYGYKYIGSCAHWFTGPRGRKWVLNQLHFTFLKKNKSKYNWVCNIPEFNRSKRPIPLWTYDWTSVGLGFVADNGTDTNPQMSTCRYSRCSHNPGLITHTGSTWWANYTNEIPVTL
eukprot:TRINITY_DN60433_c0_g2_i1.p1 TRINITY_DN60433_c0_g2~~TRINITY_DN60433_c0_g2_i1.p1  ORF type:complete len:336 (-),score=13.66 TRINITY_DN60433_c0_g2_i1:63-1004(-)